MTSLLVLVTARGGSKRLPRKNIKPLAGRSLLEWTAEALRESLAANAECLLSTDDEEIRAEGLRLGWLAPWLRPPELALDHTSSFDVAIHALDWWAEKTGSDPQLLLLMQPTSPFREPSSIDLALNLIKDQDVDAVVGTLELHRTPKTLFVPDSDGFLTPVGPSQPAKRVLTPNGALYLIRCAALRREGTFFPRILKALPMTDMESLDIDTQHDWNVATALAGGTTNGESA